MKPKELMTRNEPYRPQFHFSPTAHWINDPNGLVYDKGEYHLFYQYHPESTLWGPMHWGHAVSRDLVNWTELPIALFPDEHGTIFSGSAVIDWHNTADFGPEAMVAIFTHHHSAGEIQTQSQSLAYSLDRGRTWTKYAGNPVLLPTNRMRDFRDPKVFWYGEPQSGHWVMCLAAGQLILFYRSPNLIDWEACGGFGFGHGATDGVWETPDLFELPVDESAESRWVLTVGVGNGAPAGGSGQQYFVGHFDGETFTSENPKDVALWADYGADFYAAQSWSDAPHGQRLLIAWMNNWTYARQIPTEAWRGEMSLPRRLSLAHTAQGIRLRQQIVEIAPLLAQQTQEMTDVAISAGGTYKPELAAGSLWEMGAELVAEEGRESTFGVRLTWADSATVTITYRDGTLYFDRQFSGAVDFNPNFPAVHSAPLLLEKGVLHLQLFVDRSSVELLAQDGLLSMTERIFPAQGTVQFTFFADSRPVILRKLAMSRLAPAHFAE